MSYKYILSLLNSSLYPQQVLNNSCEGKSTTTNQRGSVGSLVDLDSKILNNTPMNNSNSQPTKLCSASIIRLGVWQREK